MAILIPFDLDSAYTGFNYNLGTLNIPRYFMPGLDFYTGVKMALDSLQTAGINLDVWIFDTRSKTQPLSEIMKSLNKISPQLILASVTNTTEQKSFAAYALQKNVPFISVTYPNDAYLHKNPFFVMENSTLQTHVDSLYSYISKTYHNSKINYLTRKGYIEEKIKKQFIDLNKNNQDIKFSVTELNTLPTVADLIPMMDSTKENIFVCGVLDEAYGLNLVKSLSAATGYRTVAIGMPTWDGIHALTYSNCKNVRIIYTSPFHYTAGMPSVDRLKDIYSKQYFAKPSDMVFKGYESTLYFVQLLNQYHDNLMNHLNDSLFYVATPFNFQPVSIDKNNNLPDYFENKKIYFINMLNGVETSIY
ncbi:MAG: hypothetical protein JSS67_02420 [Bacteroidetes bacterium]|nr:hypothetical protein [Bacteroidota bacterium]